MKLTNKLQIEVLEEAKKRIEEQRTKFFLCPLLRDIVYNKTKKSISPELVFEFFTFENAEKYSNAHKRCWELGLGKFWWDIKASGRYDRENRIKFIDWMISKLKEQENENS
jgi:hypothetical protein